MNLNSVTVTLILKSVTHFLHMPLWLITVLNLVTKGSAIQNISFKLTLIEMFNLGCNSDLEYSNPKFSPDMFLLVMIYHQTDFICERLLLV